MIQSKTNKTKNKIKQKINMHTTYTTTRMSKIQTQGYAYMELNVLWIWYKWYECFHLLIRSKYSLVIEVKLFECVVQMGLWSLIKFWKKDNKRKKTERRSDSLHQSVWPVLYLGLGRFLPKSIYTSDIFDFILQIIWL